MPTPEERDEMRAPELSEAEQRLFCDGVVKLDELGAKLPVEKEPTPGQKRLIFDCIARDARDRGFLRRELFE